MASGLLAEKSGIDFTPILEEEYISDEVSSDGESGGDESPAEKKARRLAWREKVCKMAGFDDDAAKRKASEKGKVWEVAVPQFRSTEVCRYKLYVAPSLLSTYLYSSLKFLRSFEKLH